jgi:hypothetical protein
MNAPKKCPIGMDANPGFCSAGSCTVCMDSRLAWKVKEQGLPPLPKGQHYELLNDEVVIGFDEVADPDGSPPYSEEVLKRRALACLRDTAKMAREMKGEKWEYTTNGVMSNDLEEAADILERVSSDQVFLDRLSKLEAELSGPYYTEIRGFVSDVAMKLGLKVTR